jgi:hypothetical protein
MASQVRVVTWSLAVAAALLVEVVLSCGQHPLSPSAGGVLSCADEELTPNVLFCDDFEDNAFEGRWDIGGHQGRWPISEFVQCSDRQIGFQSPCAAWSNGLTFDHEWGFYGYDARHAFPPQSEFYVRWYQYISDPYVWGTLEDKSVMLHDPGNKLVAYVGTNRNALPVEPNSGPGVPFVANYQDIDYPETGNQFTKVNRFQNVGPKMVLTPGKWYLFEWYVRLNTPGASDGATNLWIDDASRPIGAQTLRMAYTDMRWRRDSDAGKQFGVVRLTVYHQRCDFVPNTCPPNGPDLLMQYQRWDRVVVSTAPIGPLRER